jgi:hypothetical protein
VSVRGAPVAAGSREERVRQKAIKASIRILPPRPIAIISATAASIFWSSRCFVGYKWPRR